MLERIKNLKLKTQFIILTFIFSLLIIALSSFLFLNMNRILKNKINTTTEQIFNHIEMEILGFFHDIEMSANTIAYMQPIQDSIDSKTNSSTYDLYDNLRQSMNSVLLTNHNIKSAIIELENIKLSFSDMSLILDDVKDIQVERYKIYFSKLLPYSYPSDPEKLNYFAAVYRINNIRNLTSKVYSGNIIFILSKSLFDDISSRYGITKNSKLFIINSRNEVIGRMHGAIDDSFEKVVLNQTSPSGITSFVDADNKKYIYLAREIGDTGWRIASLIPYNEYFSELNHITNITIIILIAAMVIMLGFAILTTSNINAPIQKLLQAMKDISNGNLKTRCTVELNNELGVLSSHFNLMMGEIDTLTHTIFNNQQKMYELELVNKDARFFALQSQINPHFLYNALACIQGIALHYDINEIANVTQALSNIFRYSINENNYVTISAEIENIKNYVMIYQIKSAENIDLIININPDIYCLKIPKLLLQPVVENAIIHGLSRKIGSGVLTIKGCRTEGRVHFEIENDGVGIDDKKLEELNSVTLDAELPSEIKNEKRSIGIINIKQRLSLCYTTNYFFKVESYPEGSTKIIIEIPSEEC